MERYTAIVLAAGSGKRMQSAVHKQYLMLAGKPVLYYALKAFEESPVSDIILVVGPGEDTYCRENIIERYGISKVCQIVEGGKERYDSVYEGLKAARGADYVLIHDGARPFVTEEMIKRSMETVKEYGACVIGMPVKDTIKLVGENGFVEGTPDRNRLWQIQTPQSFQYGMIFGAYKKIIEQGNCTVTDDAMVLEWATQKQVKVVKGSYQNIKITTPEDLLMAETYLNQRG